MGANRDCKCVERKSIPFCLWRRSFPFHLNQVPVGLDVHNCRYSTFCIVVAVFLGSYSIDFRDGGDIFCCSKYCVCSLFLEFPLPLIYSICRRFGFETIMESQQDLPGAWNPHIAGCYC